MHQLRTWTLLILATSCCGALAAQTLEVSKSPVSVDTEYLESGTAFDHPMVAFRFEATGGDVDLNGFTLEPDGATFGTEVTDLACWLDDGDGLFDDQTDTPLWSGDPQLPETTATFTAPVTVGDGTFEDVWIVASFGASAGSSLGETYSIALGDTTDIAAGGANVIVGTPAPQSQAVAVVYTDIGDAFFIGGALIIEGSGLTPPFDLTIDGVTVHYPAPTGPPSINWTPWGDAYEGPDHSYRLLEDHTRLHIFLGFLGWPEEVSSWEWEDGTMLSVQFAIASSGQHDLGMLEYFKSRPSSLGGEDEAGGCTTADADSGLPFGLALILLALSVKAVVVATHLRHR